MNPLQQLLNEARLYSSNDQISESLEATPNTYVLCNWELSKSVNNNDTSCTLYVQLSMDGCTNSSPVYDNYGCISNYVTEPKLGFTNISCPPSYVSSSYLSGAVGNKYGLGTEVDMCPLGDDLAKVDVLSTDGNNVSSIPNCIHHYNNILGDRGTSTVDKNGCIVTNNLYRPPVEYNEDGTEVKPNYAGCSGEYVLINNPEIKSVCCQALFNFTEEEDFNKYYEDVSSYHSLNIGDNYVRMDCTLTGEYSQSDLSKSILHNELVGAYSDIIEAYNEGRDISKLKLPAYIDAENLAIELDQLISGDNSICEGKVVCTGLTIPEHLIIKDKLPSYLNIDDVSKFALDVVSTLNSSSNIDVYMSSYTNSTMCYPSYWNSVEECLANISEVSNSSFSDDKFDEYAECKGCLYHNFQANLGDDLSDVDDAVPKEGAYKYACLDECERVRMLGTYTDLNEPTGYCDGNIKTYRQYFSCEYECGKYDFSKLNDIAKNRDLNYEYNWGGRCTDERGCEYKPILGDCNGYVDIVDQAKDKEYYTIAGKLLEDKLKCYAEGVSSYFCHYDSTFGERRVSDLNNIVNSGTSFIDNIAGNAMYAPVRIVDGMDNIISVSSNALSSVIETTGSVIGKAIHSATKLASMLVNPLQTFDYNLDLIHPQSRTYYLAMGGGPKGVARFGFIRPMRYSILDKPLYENMTSYINDLLKSPYAMSYCVDKQVQSLYLGGSDLYDGGTLCNNLINSSMRIAGISDYTNVVLASCSDKDALLKCIENVECDRWIPLNSISENTESVKFRGYHTIDNLKHIDFGTEFYWDVTLEMPKDNECFLPELPFYKYTVCTCTGKWNDTREYEIAYRDNCNAYDGNSTYCRQVSGDIKYEYECKQEDKSIDYIPIAGFSIDGVSSDTIGIDTILGNVSVFNSISLPRMINLTMYESAKYELDIWQRTYASCIFRIGDNSDSSLKGRKTLHNDNNSITILPYKNQCIYINIYLYDLNWKLLRKLSYIVIPNFDLRIMGSLTKDVKTVEMSFNIVGIRKSSDDDLLNYYGLPG